MSHLDTAYKLGMWQAQTDFQKRSMNVAPHTAGPPTTVQRPPTPMTAPMGPPAAAMAQMAGGNTPGTAVGNIGGGAKSAALAQMGLASPSPAGIKPATPKATGSGFIGGAMQNAPTPAVSAVPGSNPWTGGAMGAASQQTGMGAKT